MKIWSKETVLIFVTLFFVSLLLGFTHGQHGAAISTDSLTYINVARAIANGQGIVAPNFQLTGPSFTPVTMWPPLYPAVLSSLCLFSECAVTDLQGQSVYLNTLLMFISSLLFFALARRVVNSWIALAATFSLLLLPASQLGFMYLLSEPLFIPLVLASFLCLRQYLEKPGSALMLVAALILVACATYTRYVGVAFAIALLVSLVGFGGKALIPRSRDAILSGVLYTSLISPLLVRNLIHVGHFSGGERGVPALRLQEDFINLFELMIRDLFQGRSLLFFAWILIVGLLVVFGVFSKRRDNSIRFGDVSREMFMPLMWAIIYLGFLLISRSVQNVDLDTRMLSVILPFLLLSLLGLTALLARILPRALALMPFGIVVLLSLFSGLGTHQDILENQRILRSPGVAEPRFDMYREISRSFDLNGGEVVLTDISHPQYLGYFFGETTVKMIPQLDGNIDFEALVPLERASGIVLIYDPELQEEFTKHYTGVKKPLRTTYLFNQGMQILFVELPLQ